MLNGVVSRINLFITALNGAGALLLLFRMAPRAIAKRVGILSYG